MVPVSGPPSTPPDARIIVRDATIPRRGTSAEAIGYREILDKVLADDFSNVTFSGGDPMFQPEGFAQLAKAIKERSQKNIWCYTGYDFEQLLQNKQQAELLQYIDVLVDGRYRQELRDESLLFRGSSNQRLIDVPASLKARQVVCLNYAPFPSLS